MGRKLGQHFLRSPSVREAILAAAALQPGEPVLEIGPGDGALTAGLLERGVRLTAVELDPALAEALAERWGNHPGFRLLREDVRQLDLSPQHLFGAAGRYAVVANLPYYLSTPVLFRLTAARAGLSRLVLMVQQEVALRMAARPADGKTYGALSIAVQHAFGVRVVRRVPPGAFQPPPKVDSAVVALEPRPPELPPAQEARFLEHVKGLFTRRRKLMLSTLKALGAGGPQSDWAAVECLVGQSRPEVLSPEEHLAVFRCLHPEPPGGP